MKPIIKSLLDNDEWTPTIKLSDSEGKHTGDGRMIETCKYLLHIK